MEPTRETLGSLQSAPARTLCLAASLVGSEQRLAEALGVQPMQLACWLGNLDTPPRAVVLRALAIVMQSTHDNGMPLERKD